MTGPSSTQIVFVSLALAGEQTARTATVRGVEQDSYSR